MYRKEKKSKVVYLVIATIILVSIIGLGMGTVPFVSNTVSYITSPVFKVFAGINNTVTGTWNYIANIGKLETDNKRLLDDNKKLNYENFILNEFKKENDDLRKLLNMKEKGIYDIVTGAELIGIAAESYSNLFIIDKGKNQGIQPGMIVINYDGLVGKIIETTDKSSKVMPITDDRSSTSCVIGRSGEQVILKGINTNTNGTNCKLDHITHDMDIVEGDDIITSNISDIYPAGIPVAKVKKVESEEGSLTKSVYAETMVRYKFLDKVLVIKGK